MTALALPLVLRLVPAFAIEASANPQHRRIRNGSWILNDAGLRREVELSIGSAAWHVVIREQRMMQRRLQHSGR
ncbi:hypothetical protein [uncultured Stenotrophomonas sp.]|uniref:hypothetical protein n=1 Tax=uncultured Stenotrophomonas sp. TaxID=165438 RepID=UPI0025E291BC|nr:hypothetical protein [uncultured Stenotrophomonas sp.]